MSEPARVPFRGVVEVTGPDARVLLQRLITSDVETLAPGDSRYAALLTPQGKITADFLIVATPSPDEPERFLLDCPPELASTLARRLTMYKLRAQLAIADRSETLAAIPLAEPIAAGPSGLVIYADARGPALGMRAIGTREVLEPLRGSAEDAEARRIDAAVPWGGVDYLYDDAFPHEANLDRLHGVDFTKGCYVGQEVVSRMQHRGTTRKRVTKVLFEGAPPPPGTAILAGDVPVGTMGSSVAGRGLALIRLDRAAEATAPLMAGQTALRLAPA